MSTLYDRIDHALETGSPNQELVEYIAPRLAHIAVGDFGEDSTATAHPLDFYSLHLERKGDRSVCIHDWCGCFSEPEANVVGVEHDHSWDMKSRLLRGGITDAQLQVVTGLYIPDATHLVFDTQTDGVKDTLTFINQWGIITDSHTTTYGTGETYGFGKGKPHSSDASEDLLTLILARNYPGTTNRSFTPIGASNKLTAMPYKKYSLLRSPLGRFRTQLLAEHIIEALGITTPKQLADHPARLPLEVREALPNNHVPGREAKRIRSLGNLILPKGQLT